jgi:hypothetical protein
MDAALTSATTRVGVHPESRNGSSRMSRVCASWSTIPTTMNSAALNSPWASTNAHPAAVASGWPMPRRTTMKPSWLIVPKASSCFRSKDRNARKPPATIVTSPTVTTSGRHTPTPAKAGARRATRYTPAFTIAAEWR